MSKPAFKNAFTSIQKQLFLILISLIGWLSVNGQNSSKEIRIPDYMKDEMKYLESQERSLKDTADGLGSIYDSVRRKEELDKVYKQKQELQDKIKNYQEKEFKRLQSHKNFQDQFKSSTAIEISKLNLNTKYTNIRFTQNGEVFPELTIIKSDGIFRTIKVLTSMGSTEFLQSSATVLYLAK